MKRDPIQAAALGYTRAQQAVKPLLRKFCKMADRPGRTCKARRKERRLYDVIATAINRREACRYALHHIQWEIEHGK